MSKLEMIESIETLIKANKDNDNCSIYWLADMIKEIVDSLDLKENKMNRGCCNECGYKADYIIDKNNCEANGYEDLNQVPHDKMLCGACYEEKENERI